MPPGSLPTVGQSPGAGALTGGAGFAGAAALTGAFAGAVEFWARSPAPSATPTTAPASSKRFIVTPPARGRQRRAARPGTCGVYGQRPERYKLRQQGNLA